MASRSKPNPYIQNHVVQPLQGALAVQDVELAYELPDAYFHIQTCDDGFDYTLYNKDFTERDGGILETDGDKSVQEAMTELLAEFGCDAAQGKVVDAAELREQADTVAAQKADALKEKLAAERPAPVESISFYVAECSEFTFAGEYHDHLTMEEALEVYDKIPSETPVTVRGRLEEQRPNTFIGRPFGVSDVMVWDEEEKRKFFYVDKDELVEFGGFTDIDSAGNVVALMVPNYQVDGKTGTWLPYDSEVVEGVCFFMMRNDAE